MPNRFYRVKVTRSVEIVVIDQRSKAGARRFIEQSLADGAIRNDDFDTVIEVEDYPRG